jgi:hypothetical protein
MTQSQINRASKKADAGLCKLQDLFYGYDLSSPIADRVSKACDAIREVISAIESTQPEKKTKTTPQP